MRVITCSFLAAALSLCVSAQAAQTDDGAGDAASVSAQDTYPHITKLETYILGQTYINQPLSARISRMEQKAFGRVSTDPDLSARTDALTQYADDKLGKKTPVATDSGDYSYDTPDGGNGSAAADSGASQDYPHITALETEILGQSYSGQPLADRLNRMETKAFGSPSNTPDLSDRTDALERYAEKVLHKKPFANEAPIGSSDGGGGGDPGSAQGSGRGKQFLAMMGNTMLGIAGFPGGFSGVRVRPKSAVQQQQQAEETSERPPEDPLVHAPTPPPPGTKLITQVGWCEVQVFGHTSPQLHLAERLEQLNREVKFDPNQTGFDLMDDIGSLMKIVEARRPPAQAVGSASPQAGTGAPGAPAPTAARAAAPANANQAPRAVGATPRTVAQ